MNSLLSLNPLDEKNAPYHPAAVCSPTAKRTLRRKDSVLKLIAWLQSNKVFCLLAIFLIVAALQTIQLSELSVTSRTLGAKVAEIRLEREALLSGYPSPVYIKNGEVSTATMEASPTVINAYYSTERM